MAHMVLRLASASGRPVLSTRQPDHGRTKSASQTNHYVYLSCCAPASHPALLLAADQPGLLWPTRELAGLLARRGHDTALVGGPVRDAFLGRPHGDLDLTTDARPEQ